MRGHGSGNEEPAGAQVLRPVLSIPIGSLGGLLEQLNDLPKALGVRALRQSWSPVLEGIERSRARSSPGEFVRRDDLRQVIVTRLGERFPDGMKFFDGV